MSGADLDSASILAEFDSGPCLGETPDLANNVRMPEQVDADVRVFLIADIRGYTRFTQERGDAAAAELASKFAAIVAEVVTGHGGRLMELRGDEALVSFGSPRGALSLARSPSKSASSRSGVATRDSARTCE